jgi:hypothetical protein
MKAFLVSTSDRPGLAARLFLAASARGVNVDPAYGLSDGNRTLMLVGSDDEGGLVAAIAEAELAATPYEIVVTELDNRPGAGADLFSRLAAEGVDLRVAVPIGREGDRVQVGLAASDPAALTRALGSAS